MLLDILGSYGGLPCKYPEHFIRMVLRQKLIHLPLTLPPQNQELKVTFFCAFINYLVNAIHVGCSLLVYIIDILVFLLHVIKKENIKTKLGKVEHFSIIFFVN